MNVFGVHNLSIYVFIFRENNQNAAIQHGHVEMAIEMREGREETLKLLSKITITLVSNNCCSP